MRCCRSESGWRPISFKPFPSEPAGGQQQRVAIAWACHGAFIHDPLLMVCDEPTAALDAHTGQTILELLRQAAMQSERAVIG